MRCASGDEQGRFEEMAVLPGMEEVVSLLHIYRQAREGSLRPRDRRHPAPTGETIRLLSVPESFQWYAGAWRVGAIRRCA